MNEAQLREVIAQWRQKAKESREEADRIYQTVKESEEYAAIRCLCRSVIWNQCADTLESILVQAKPSDVS